MEGAPFLGVSVSFFYRSLFRPVEGEIIIGCLDLRAYEYVTVC